MTAAAAASRTLKAQGDKTKRTPSSAFDPAAGQETYEPERIVGTRTVKSREKGGERVTQFEVKWVGWETKDNTWEPIEHLAGCEDMIAEFKEREKTRLEQLEKVVAEKAGDAYRDHQLTLDDWRINMESVAVLQPIADWTQHMQGTQYPTLPLVLPTVYGLIQGKVTIIPIAHRIFGFHGEHLEESLQRALYKEPGAEPSEKEDYSSDEEVVDDEE